MNHNRLHAPQNDSGLRDNLGVHGAVFEVMPNMVDMSAVQDAGRGRTSQIFGDNASPSIVTMGRLVRSKGQRDLVSAIALINRRRPCNLLVLGDGGDRGRLEAMARDLGIAGKVAFTGFLANPFEFVARADVFVSPSHRESFGNAIVEAMALGIPVVSTRVPCGPEWIISDGSTGIFAEAQNPTDLAKKIELLLDDPVLSGSIGASGRQMAQQNFDVNAVVARYALVLRRAALGSHRRTAFAASSEP